MWYMSLIFRDIKPENILFKKGGHCKLGDFGLSAVGIFKWSVATTFCGAQHYMAPEVIVTFYFKCVSLVLMFLFYPL
jgi:Serine/threonine protein kinase